MNPRKLLLPFLVLLSILGIFGGLIHWHNNTMLEKDADHFFRYVLADGNMESAYKNSDITFRSLYPQADFKSFADQHAAWFKRSHIQCQELIWVHQGDNLFVVMKAKIQGKGGEIETAEYYSRPGFQNEWRLVGIQPGLMGAIPSDLKPYKK